MKKRLCPVCQLRPGSVVSMCDACQRSYDTTLGGDIIGVIVWAAERARYFARRSPIECRDCKSITPAHGPCPGCGVPAEVEDRPTRGRPR